MIARAWIVIALAAAPAATAPPAAPTSPAPSAPAYTLPGSTAPAVADSFDVFFRAGHYADAERVAREELAAAERAVTPDGLPIAIALERLVRARVAMSRIGPADVELTARALAIRERAYGESDPRIAPALNVNAFVLWRLDRLDAAQAVAERALSLLQGAEPEHDAEQARCLHVLGNIALDLGDLETAVTRTTELHAMRERLNGPDSPEAAQALHNVGIALHRSGRHLEAMQTYRRALEIRERVLGPDHTDVAWTLNNLANVFYDLGDFTEAVRLNRRALEIRERQLGPDHPDVGLCLNNLANAIERTGDAAAAVPLHERALAIREAALGPWHRNVAQSLNNLGLAVMELGDLDRAEALFERSIAIRDSLLGPGSEEAARTRLRLGVLHLRAGAPADAERVLREAVEANHRTLGSEHPSTADAEIALACALLRLGGNAEAVNLKRDAEALDLGLAAERKTVDHLRLTAQGLDEAQALIYAATRSSGLDVALTLAAASPNDTAVVARVWDALVRSRSVVLDEMIARRRWAAATTDSVAHGLRRRVAEARGEFARLALQGAGADSAGAQHVAATATEKREAERALAERSVAFRRELAQAAAGLPEIRAALPRDAAMVSYAWYGRLPRGAASDTVSSVVGFVVGPGRSGPRAVALGSASAVDGAIRAWLSALHRPPDPLRRAHDERACADAGRDLARLIWDPISPLVAGAERVFVVPDAALHVTPISALPDARGVPLIESGPLIQTLAIERDLTDSRDEASTGRGLLAIGGPAFDDVASGGSSTAPRTADDPCAILEGGRFELLPGASAEVAAIERVWNAAVPAGSANAERARVLTAMEAREGAVRTDVSGRRALHIATHGFFLPPRCPFVAAGTEENAPVTRRHPLLRAGLALAGANQRAATLDPADDGILTAEEVAGLDLGSLDWVVLSACETGLGEVDINEGVLGLRRAFRAAGARAIVMSLWRVDDAATAEWMEALYRARFGRGLDGAAAAREASREILSARRAAGRSAHPYYWAAFAFEGDDRRPIDGFSPGPP
jgi:CHAT domain-containing protein/Tfp pilus assembly protein PilF